MPDFRRRGSARMYAARNAIHLVALSVAGFAGNHEQTCFRIVKSTNAFEDRFDGAIDAEARIGKDGNFLQQFQPVLQLGVITTPTRDDVTKDQQANRRQQKVIEMRSILRSAVNSRRWCRLLPKRV